MAEVVNLRQARKRKQRALKEEQAEANRIRHGLSKSEREAATKEQSDHKKFVEQHQLDKDEETD